jgi:hypothetical protein
MNRTTSPPKRLAVILIKPSHYDNQGFVYRFARGVLPSNTLAIMQTLTQQALSHISPAGTTTMLYALDDGITRDARQLERLRGYLVTPDMRIIVALVGVQTAQFPRACDLIKHWQQIGATCVIGGSHVTSLISTMYDGIHDRDRTGIPCPQQMPPEILALIRQGTIIFHGEAEPHADGSNAWADALCDVISQQPQPLYRGGQPDIGSAPLPHQPAGTLCNYATTIRTIDTSRGCPFKCSFCAVINFQGRTMRCRDPNTVVTYVRDICQSEGKAFFFFTDDNFARNPSWQSILSDLAALRQQGLLISFMIQADLACGKIPGFIEQLSAAGCSQIFFGVESLNPANLAIAGKTHNKPAHYRQLWDRCHQLGIVVHVAYIIGFPHDTPDSVRVEVERLLSLGADQASFFMLCPLPGSEDHIRLHQAGRLDGHDWNTYDSFHAVTDHHRMTRQEWRVAFDHAWQQFYQPRHMIAALRRLPGMQDRQRLLSNYVWYWWSTRVEKTHPMIAGFYRSRSFADRRPGSPKMRYGHYLCQEGWRLLRYLGYFLAGFYLFQHVVFETEYRSTVQKKQTQLTDNLRGFRNWARRTFGPAMSRQWLNEFWLKYGRRRWQLLNPLSWIWHLRMLPHAMTEIVYTIRFACKLARLLQGVKINHSTT